MQGSLLAKAMPSDQLICRACHSSVEHVTNLGSFAIVNQLQADSGDKAQKIPFEIGICVDCSLVQLTNLINPSVFYTVYPTPSSWKPEPHLGLLVDFLRRLDSQSTCRVLDIGCNDGKFLAELRSVGFEKLAGVEPSQNTAALARSKGFAVFNEYFDLDSAASILEAEGKFDVLVSRQVLEHVHDLNLWLQAARILLESEGRLILEVPDFSATVNLRDYALWEEHVNYFTLDSLRVLLERNDFDLVESWTSEFAGVCLTVVCRPRNTGGEERDRPKQERHLNPISDFLAWLDLRSQVASLVREEILNAPRGRGLLIGVGARSSMAVNLLGLTDLIDFAVDDNVNKQGKYMPNGRIPIVSRGKLASSTLSDSQVLLGVNGENEDQLLSEFRPQLSRVLSLLPPSKHTPAGWRSLQVEIA